MEINLLYHIAYTYLAISHSTFLCTINLHNVESILQLLNYIKTLKMCPGNGLTRYLTIAKQRGGTLKNKSG